MLSLYPLLSLVWSAPLPSDLSPLTVLGSDSEAVSSSFITWGKPTLLILASNVSWLMDYEKLTIQT